MGDGICDLFAVYHFSDSIFIGCAGWHFSSMFGSVKNITSNSFGLNMLKGQHL